MALFCVEGKISYYYKNQIKRDELEWKKKGQ